MRIALAQLNYIPGDVAYNSSRIISAIEEARAGGAELVIFSEMAITGYPPQDLLLGSGMLAEAMAAAEEIALHCRGIAAVVGGPSPNMGSWGKSMYNSALFMTGSTISAVVSKALLPTYDIFDEARYFRPAEQFRPVTLNGARIAITICEDIWDEHQFNERGTTPLYGISPLNMLMKESPALIVNLAAIPFAHDRAAYRESVFTARAAKAGVPLIVVNQAGGSGELVFDGSSVVIGPDGTILERLTFCGEEIRIIDLPLDHKPDHGSFTLPGPQPGEMTTGIHQALVTGIRDFFRKSGISRAVIGLSGGLDSAVVTTLAAEALGPENVLALMMPSRYSSDHSVNDSIRLTENLNIPYHIVSIEEAREAIGRTLRPFFAGREPDTTEENIQPRIRTIMLMAFANKLGMMLLNASNKSELATGYTTLYGDMSGALAVIGDLYKTEVYRLAAAINSHGRVLIPEEIIVKPPSAELRPGQLDTDSLPPYTILDPVLYRYLNLGMNAEQIAAEGFDETVVRRIVKMVSASEFKRKQAPPILRVSSKAFGTGRRIPVVSGIRQ